MRFTPQKGVTPISLPKGVIADYHIVATSDGAIWADAEIDDGRQVGILRIAPHSSSVRVSLAPKPSDSLSTEAIAAGPHGHS